MQQSRLRSISFRGVSSCQWISTSCHLKPVALEQITFITTVYGVETQVTKSNQKPACISVDNTTYSKRFSSRWYLCTWKCSYALHPVSQKFPQNDTFETVYLTDDGTLLYFQGRPSSTSSFRTSLLQAIDDVMSLALCRHAESQTPQHFQSSKAQVICNGCFIYSKHSIANATKSKQSSLFFCFLLLLF